MATTPVSPGAGNSPDNGATVTNGNILDVQSGGIANNTTVQSGGTLQVDAGGAENNATIQAGGSETVTGTIGGNNVVTSAATSTGDLDYGTITVGSGGAVSNVTVESGGLLALSSKSASVNGATVLSGGAITINGNAPANNVTLAGGSLELISPKADSVNTTTGVPSATGTLTFASGSASRLQIDVAQTGTNGTTFAQTITGFAQGDVIDLGFITNGVISETANGSNTNVTVTGTGGSETFTFVGAAPANLKTAADTTPEGGTDLIVTCFASGTLITTARGAIPVEHLTAGDLAVTASGGHRPIKWLGHRTIDCRRHPHPEHVLPVRIAAHAFSANRPARDLFVSPGHAICVDVCGEVLIPAGALVNGATIRQMEVDTVTYWHVELDSHDVILAENLPAESYLDMGNRGFFTETEVAVLAAGPDADPAQRTHADFCRPYVNSGPVLDGVRAQLATRAEAAGWSLTNDIDLHLVVDGARIEPVVRDLVARFHMPAAARDVWLVSPTARPCDTMGSPDTRDLGLTVTALRIDDGLSAPRAVSVSDPLLCIGFHALGDDCRRWTAGRARLPAALWDGFETDFYLRLDLAGRPVPRWRAPASASWARPGKAVEGYQRSARCERLVGH
jgi:autotransporter passenger strand-loop-strand repeat protein